MRAPADPVCRTEKLIRALLVQAVFSVRSERPLMQQPDDNLLVRWFVSLSMDAPVWNAAVLPQAHQMRLPTDRQTQQPAGSSAGCQSRSRAHLHPIR